MSEVIQKHATSSRRRRKKPPALSEQVTVLLAGLTVLLALLLVVLGVRLFTAALKDYQASRFLASWEQKGQIPNEQSWQFGLQAMQAAQNWYPTKNAEFAEQLGYMWQWRAHQPGQLTTEQQQLVEHAQQQALAKFRSASELRPRWPFAWSGLAYAKLVANELDDEFDKALRLAQHYGPERNPINSRLAEIGLIAWDHLNTSQQQLVFASMQKATKYGPASRKALYTIADQTQRTDWLCQQLADEKSPCDTLSTQAAVKESTP